MRPALAILAVAAAAGPVLAGEGEPEPGEWLDVRGGFEAGVRAVTEKEGRYEQDVNLDGGFRLLSADLEGTAFRDGPLVDAFSLSLRGLGDPNRLANLRLRAEDAFDFRFRADRQSYIHRAEADPHPFDTTRDAYGASLAWTVAPGLVLRWSDDRQRRTGDAGLEMKYRDDQPFPAAATLDYDGRFRTLGFDGTAGDFRCGASWTTGRAEDDSLRTLLAPASNAGDTGRYRSLSEIATSSATARAGLRLLDRRLDLSVAGGWHAAETDTDLETAEVVTTAANVGQGYTDVRARTEANARGWFGRGEALLLPHADWEVLGRYESRSDRVVGHSDALLRDLPPPFTPPGPYSPRPESTRTDATLARAGLETRWRASRAWRFRLGGERVLERIELVESELYQAYDRRTYRWEPETVAATAGADWSPVASFDASVLARGSRTSGAPTEISADEGRSLSVRLRGRSPGGWHAAAFLRLKQRRGEDANAFSTYDAYGWSGGFAGERRRFDLTLSREDLTTASDTAFVVDAGSPTGTTPTPHRVRYDEEVTQASLDFSSVLYGPVRAFGALRWADGRGDAPYVQSDASLGLGWTFAEGAELKVEGRRVAYAERDRSRDDFAARILTVSIAWTF